MLNIETYINYLWLYVKIIIAIGIIILILINLLLLLVKLICHFSEKKVWILANIIIVAIFVVLVAPACLDINQKAFNTIENVIDIKTDIVANKSSKYMIVTDANGETYELYDYLINTEDIDNAVFPGTVIYAKNSKLMLVFLSETTINQ